MYDLVVVLVVYDLRYARIRRTCTIVFPFVLGKLYEFLVRKVTGCM